MDDAPPDAAAVPPLRLSVVIPAYQEARRLPANLARVAGYLDGLFPPAAGGGDSAARAYEVLVMVERSADDTLARCREVAAGLGRAFQVCDNQVHRGKGYAVRLGMRRARGEVHLFMDADLSTPLEEIGRFLAHLDGRPEVDVLIGDRRRAVHRQGARRRLLGGAFRALARRVVGAGGSPAEDLPDTQCGFKVFRRAASAGIFSRQTLDGFAFDVEVLRLANRLGLTVRSLPVPGWSDAPFSTLRILRDGALMLRDLVRVRPGVERALRERPPGAGTPAAPELANC